MLTIDQKQSLLALARKVVECQIHGRPVPRFEANDPLLAEPRGAFVTLHNHGHLRGCIGQFTARGPLVDTIRDMALAATQDSRFTRNPIRPAELPQLDIEISVLSPLERTADPLALELGVHGIYIKRGWAAGCFLPQVATETGWTKEEFLTNCCSGKAGLSPNAWQLPDTEIYLFTAEIFGEKET